MQNAPLSYRAARHTLQYLHRQMKAHKLPDWLSEEVWVLSRVLSFAQKAAHLPKGDIAAAEESFERAFSVLKALPTAVTERELCDACRAMGANEPTLRLLPFALCAEVLDSIAKHVRERRVPDTSLRERWVSRIHAILQMDYAAVWEETSAVEKTLLSAPLGIYAKSDRNTKAEYRAAVYRMAKKQGTDERSMAHSLLQKAKAGGVDIASLLFEDKDNTGSVLYFVSVAVCVVLVSFLVGVFLYPYGAWHAVAMGLFSLLPLYAFFREGMLLLFAHRRPKPLLALSHDACPTRGVLTVITTLLTGEKNDSALFDALEMYYLRNRGEGKVFGILGDLPPHTRPEAVEDERTLAYAKARIDALKMKYGESFCLYVRNRQYAASEKRFFAKERKRGALLALARLLRGSDREEFLEITEPKNMGHIAYICTLDADTVLPFGAIDTMLSVMEHPYNRPVIENGRVVRGIGILQPAMATLLSSATETPFSAIMAGNGGYDPYGRYAHDIEDTVFGHGGYCGKGMFCVDAYLAVLDGAFPSERILSHDFLEGQRLASRTISSVTFLDTQPSLISPYYQRQERWVRGDVQSLPYAFASVHRENGEKVKNPVAFADRMRIFDHVLYAMTPIGILRAVIFVSFVFPNVKTGLCLFSVIFSPYLLRPFLLLSQKRAWIASVRTFSALALSDLRHAFASLCYRLIFVCHEGYINAKAVFLALWRLCISKKHLLSWTTASEAERKLQHGGLFSYVWYFRYSVLIGAVLLFSPSPLAKVFSVLWLLSPICASLLDKPHAKLSRKKLSSAQIRRLRAYAAPIWRYFEDHVTSEEHHLPPDNVQWFPHTKKQVAHRTSPTNIGLYLLSCLSALRFALITPKETVLRLQATLDTLSELEACHGHFYNWYDTESGGRIGAPYLSAVDSGNLACALIAAASACERYAAADMRFLTAADRMRTIARNMDFTIFYDARRSALAIGFDTEKNERIGGYYDLYCSEARSAVYFAVAMGQIPGAAWEALARPILTHGRRIGVSSWTGSAFEYFMPALWLSVPENSFSYEMLSYAADMQISDREYVCTADGCYALFGRSEGAYYAFDEGRTYQYQPCGVSSLGAKPHLSRERLIMPYATFLMLPFAKGKHADIASVLYQNLDCMEAVGMWGDYGFFEALDMTPSRVGGGYAVVRSVMAHHLGMSLVALTNTAFDDWFPTCFASYGPMKAGKLLLQERIPTDALPAYIENENPTSYAAYRQTEEAVSACPVHRDGERSHAVLSNTHAFVMASSAGALYLRSGKYDISVPPISEEGEMLRALPPLFWMHANGKIYSPCMLCAMDRHAAEFSFFVDDTQILFEARYTDGVTATLSIALSLHADVFSFTLDLSREGISIPFTLSALMRPVLCERRAYQAHPTFCDLFLSLDADEERGRVTVRRRPRGEEEGEIALTLCAGTLTEFGAQTALDRILPLGYDKETLLRVPYRADEICRFAPPSSAVVPAIFLKGRAIGKTTLTLGRDRFAEEISPHMSLSTLRAEHRMLSGGISHSDSTLSCMLYFAMYRETVLLQSKKGESAPYAAQDALYRHGISGDLPIFLFTLDDTDAMRAAMQKTLFAWKYLVICGIRADLVFAITEDDPYEKPIFHMLKDMIRGAGLSFFEGKPGGGIFIMSDSEAHADGLYLRAVWTWGKDVPKPSQERRMMAPRHIGEACYAINEQRAVLYKGRQAVPWSHILTNSVFSTLLTHDTLGFTFFTNARECRVTPWYPEAISERCGERLLLQIGKYAYDLCAAASTWEISPLKAVYIGHIGAIAYEVHVGIPDRRKRKEMLVRIANMGGTDGHVTLTYEAEVLLGTSPSVGEAVYIEHITDGIAAQTATNPHTKGYTAEVTVSSEKGEACMQAVYGRRVCVSKACRLSSGERWEATFALSVWRKGERRVEKALPHVTAPCGKYIHTGYPYFDVLANTWLPVQIYHSRLWARCGFWQPGGAYGFRDQLQDAMAAVYLHADTLKRQIFRAAAHQYREGDVQHWWHALPVADKNKFHRGIRSRCSDDYLWLALACAHYVDVTGDQSILDAEIRYLESAPLTDNVHERYEEPLRSGTKESLYMHCVRALEHGFSFGSHGLPLMGTGDWNDGMNAVGLKGKGESVWGGMFLLYVLAKFLPLCEMRGDEDGAKRYRKVMKDLALSIETHAWNGSWYLRAWYDDGTPMGQRGDAEAEIDLLPQAFAAIINKEVRVERKPPFDPARVKAALLLAYERLYDEKSGTFALLSPPFSKAEGMLDPGYISSYIPGVRENGGQYTHAAVWGAMGLFTIGEDARGTRVLRSLSPMYLTRDTAHLVRYQKEPYALCGDVLRAEGRHGEGGWSLYTGSAAWYLRLLLSLFGNDREIKPEIPKEEDA